MTELRLNRRNCLVMLEGEYYLLITISRCSDQMDATNRIRKAVILDCIRNFSKYIAFQMQLLSCYNSCGLEFGLDHLVSNYPSCFRFIWKSCG